MSQVTEQSVRFQTALASIKLIQASAVLDLTEDDFDRSEERRVGKECRSRWSADRERKKGYTSGRRIAPGRCVLSSTASSGSSLVFCTAPPSTDCHLRREAVSGSWSPRGRPFFFQAEDGIRDRSRHSC